MEELVSFLVHPRKEVRLVAANHLAGLSSAKNDSTISANRAVIAKGLMNCLGASVSRMAQKGVDDDHEVTHEAFRCMINLSEDSEFIDCLLELKTAGSKDIVDILMAMMNMEKYMFAEFACMLLNNISRSLRVCDRIVSLDINTKGKEGLTHLVKAPQDNFDPYRWLMTVIVNVSRVGEAINLLISPERGLLKSLLSMLENKDLIRRGGAVSLVRNILFDKSRHEYLASDDVRILPYLLLPLAGPEEYDDDDVCDMYDELQYLPSTKTREPDASVRLLLVECIKLLCQTRLVREQLRKKKVYPLLRELDKSESDARIKDTIYSIICIIMMDEKSEITTIQTPGAAAAEAATHPKAAADEKENEPVISSFLDNI